MSDSATTTQETTSETHREETDRAHERTPEEAVEVVATSTIKLGLLILGILLLLFAVGQAVGYDFLAMLSETLDTPQARWMIVAFFALILIVVSLQDFGRTR